MNRWLTHLVPVGAVALVLGGTMHVARAADEVKLKYGFATYGYSSSQPFSKPSGVFYDANRGEVYVADTGNGQIVILDKKGVPIARIRHSVVDPSSGDRHPGEPRSVVVRKNGDIIVADNLCNYLDVLDFQGRSVQKVWPADLLGLPKSKVQPRCLAQDGAGNVYLGVSGSAKEILVLGTDLKLRSQMGVESTGESKSVTGLWADSGGRIYATYALGTCVQVYAPDGEQLLGFGDHDSGPQNFSLPSGLITDEKGRLWTVDTIRHVVTVFKLESTDSGLKSSFLTMVIGGTASDGNVYKVGQSAGDLTYPSAIAGDGSTLIYTLESTGARVQAFEIISDRGSGKPS